MQNAALLLVIDRVGVFVFALSGATAAVRQRLDLFGVPGKVTFYWHREIERLHNPVRVFDTIGLGLFAVAGTHALAALAGSLIVCLGHWLEWPAVPTAIAGAALCFALRILAMWFDWRLPSAQRDGN